MLRVIEESTCGFGVPHDRATREGAIDLGKPALHFLDRLADYFLERFDIAAL